LITGYSFAVKSPARKRRIVHPFSHHARHVVDAEGRPIPDANVRAGRHADITQSGGSWGVHCRRKSCRVVIKARGYRTVRIRVEVPEIGEAPFHALVMERR